ncbi:MAG: hypothetical protein HY904_16060 [Deltaproteobacteria bacterium]|nr:hypothetical protein [Deltaproteobacteria bacterium]
MRLQRPLIVLAAAATAVVSLLLIGCPCQGAACNKADAGAITGCVPDQSFSRETAVAATAGTPITGKICPVTDQDYYNFTTTATDTLAEITLETTTTLSAVDFSINVMDAAANVVASTRDTDGSDGATTLRLVAGLQPNAPYFIQVADVSNDESDNNTEYTLQLALRPDPDTHEPNPPATPSTADTSAAGNRGWLSTTGDQDAYTFTAAAGSILRFELSTSDASLAFPAAVVTSADGTQLYTSPMLPITGTAGTRSVRANVALRKPGPYTCLVADAQGNADFRDPEGAYTLRLEIVPDPDEDERAAAARNDTLATAIKSNAPVTRRPALATVGDLDHYMVMAPAALATGGRKLLEVTLSLPAGTPLSNFDPAVAVWDQVIFTSSSQSANCQQLAGPGAARYLCRKPCGAGSSCAQGQGGPLQECMPADVDQPNVDRYCAEPRIARPLRARADGSISTSLRFPLRSGRNPVVLLQDQLSDSFDERVFSVELAIVDDPDTHEPDSLPPPLLTVGGGDTDVRGQDFTTFPHVALNSGAGYAQPCATQPVDGGVPDSGPGCMGRTAVDGGSTDPTRQPLNCGNFNELTQEVTGYLAYEGDRDYFRFEVPEGFYALDVEYTYDPPGGGTTPVELTMFVYAADASGDLTSFYPMRGSFVRTEQVDSVNANVNCQYDSNCPGEQECRVRPGQGVCKRNTGEVVASPCSGDGECPQGSVCRPNGPTGGVCRGDCASNLECTNPDGGVNGAVCIEHICFRDEDSNAGTGGQASFGPSSVQGECLFANQCNTRPFWVEVVDNGLNDSDLRTPYTLRVRVSCGCPVNACGAGVCNYVPCSVGN